MFPELLESGEKLNISDSKLLVRPKMLHGESEIALPIAVILENRCGLIPHSSPTQTGYNQRFD